MFDADGASTHCGHRPHVQQSTPELFLSQLLFVCSGEDCEYCDPDEVASYTMEHPRVLCCTPCALLAWKLSEPFQPSPFFEEGAIVGYVTEWDVAYRRDIIVRVVQRRAFSEPPSSSS